MAFTDNFIIRPAEAEEYRAVGQLTVSVYQALPGMPGPSEQPEYYRMLAETGQRAAQPGVQILVATGRDNALIGAVTFYGQMAYYGSGGVAPSCADAAGIRLLAVNPGARNRGAGRALTRACIRRAKTLGAKRVILHTTMAMSAAWSLYLAMGFGRCPELDFMQKTLPVFGFELELAGQPQLSD